MSKRVIIIALTIFGLAGGYLYWYYVGCRSGSCPITSRWYMSAIWGGVLGYFLGDLIVSIIKRFGKAHDIGSNSGDNQE